MVAALVQAIFNGWDNYEICQTCEDRKLRDNLTEEQVDDMIAHSFPASDPPSTY